MFDPADSLRPALARAGKMLDDAQRALAHAATGAGGRSADAAMADAARAAIFDEALMNALHARLSELKNVTH